MYYKTKEGIEYKVLSYNEVDEKTILNSIKNSTYFDTHYLYATEGCKISNKLANTDNNKKRIYLTQEKHNYLSSISMGFDIETTLIKVDDKHFSYMYHWQLSINNIIITGRKWEELNYTFNILETAVKKEIKLALNRTNKRYTKKSHPKVNIWVANLPYEFQFIKDRLQFENIFAKSTRKPLNANIQSSVSDEKKSDTIFVFRDCLQITGGSLEYLAKNYTTTQKRKGDLDYSLIRNSKTVLTKEELQYCYDDVAILSEFNNYYYNEYKDKGFAPITSTGILRHEVKSLQTMEDVFKIWNDFPSEDEYNYFMNYAFKGGYAHGNIRHTSKLLKDTVRSRDIDSSYPYVMLTKQFPMGKFVYSEELENNLNTLKTNEEVFEYVSECLKSFNFLTTIKLKNVRSINDNTYISLSKCINKQDIKSNLKINSDDNFPKSMIDNGRILRAEETITVECDVDLLTIMQMYSFTHISFINTFVATSRDYLPNYITEPLKTAYSTKNKLKTQGKSNTTVYKISKGKVNSGYGMTCAKMVIKEILYNQETCEWGYSDKEKTWEEKREQAFLNPMWGIWVSAYARRRLMEMIIKCNENNVIDDTDSVYYNSTPDIEKAFNEENNRVIEGNKKQFPNETEFWSLGTWDKQSVDDKGNFVAYEQFSGRGAKRYLLYGWNDGKYGWKQTIAGLPKGVLEKVAEEQHTSPMNLFLSDNGFSLDKVQSTKKTAIYNDFKHTHYVEDYQGNTELMEEMSSISIVDIPFTMSINEVYKLAINYYTKNYDEKYERRLL